MYGALTFPEISPFVFPNGLFGYAVPIRWYAIAYIVGIAIGWQVIAMALRRPHLWRNDTPPMPVARLEDLLTYIVVGVIGGGRLGYVLFYRPDFYFTNPLDIVRIWDGGMSFHGGFIGVVLAVWLFSRRNDVPLGQLADVVALAATPAILLVRIANFVNAELWGRPADVPWAVIFPGAAAQACDNVAGVCARHPSQLYEAGLEGLLLGALIMLLAFRFGALKQSWLLSGVFFAGYGLARFIVEFFRQPDAQFVSDGNPLGLAFHVNGWGLTMGQTLTLPMILIGVAVIVWAKRAS